MGAVHFAEQKINKLYARFLRKLLIPSQVSCWEWQGAKNHAGYGDFFISLDDSHHLAHRVSWTMFNGPIADGYYVLHKCDNPACVNPDHLFLGSQKDNVQDAMNKGRMRGQFQPGHGSTRPFGWTEVACDGCGNLFLKRNSQMRVTKRHYCNRVCSGKGLLKVAR